MSDSEGKPFESDKPKAQRGFWNGVIAGVLALGLIVAVVVLVLSAADNEQLLEPSIDPNTSATAITTTTTTTTTVAVAPEDQQAESADDSFSDSPLVRRDPAMDTSAVGGPRNIVIAPNGQIITAHDRDNIVVWTPDDTEPLQMTHIINGVGDTIVGLSDGRIASAVTNAREGAGQTVYLWDPAEPSANVEMINTQFKIQSLIALDDGQLLVDSFRSSISQAPVTLGVNFQIWDTTNLDSEPLTFPGRFGLGRHFAVLPDGRIAQGSGDIQNDNIAIWDPTNPFTGLRFLGEHPGGVQALAALPDGRLVSIGTVRDESELFIWDTDGSRRDPQPVSVFSERLYGATSELSDGRLAFREVGNGVRIWDPANPDEEIRVLAGIRGDILSIADFGDGQILVGLRDETSPLLVNPNNGAVVLGFANRPTPGSD